MRGRRRTLYTRIYLHFIGVLFVVALATLAIFAFGFRGEFMHGLADRYSRHASFLLGDVMDDPAKREEIAKHLADVVNADLTVRNADGVLLVVVGDEIPAPDRPVNKPQKVGHGRASCFVAPIRNRETGAVLGFVQANPWKDHGPSPAKHLLLLVGVLAIVGLAVRPLAKRISRPVAHLTEATRRFGAGDLSHRIVAPGCRPGDAPMPPRRADELGDLMRAWNEMADRIETLVKGHRELLANVSHELRSPLARMRVALELLPKTVDSETRLADVEQDIAELDRLIDDVLTASRLEATGLPSHPEPASVASIFEQLKNKASHDPLLAGKELRFAAPAEITLTADAALLKRALWNLVENAAKYGATPIVVEAESRDGRVLLSVRDHGAGVPAGERVNVFAPFARVDKARTPDAAGRQGFGLGLTIARRVAEAHGGAIRLEGEPANRFVLDLPLAPPAPAR